MGRVPRRGECMEEDLRDESERAPTTKYMKRERGATECV